MKQGYSNLAKFYKRQIRASIAKFLKCYPEQYACASTDLLVLTGRGGFSESVVFEVVADPRRR